MEKDPLVNIRGVSEIRRHIPDFDFYRIENVLNMTFSFSYRREDEHTFQTTDAAITCTYVYQDVLYVIEFALYEVKDLSLPKLGTFFQLGEFDVFPSSKPTFPNTHWGFEDALDGMVGYCRDIAFLSLGTQEAESPVSLLWQRGGRTT
jgi:hypothetical protein